MRREFSSQPTPATPFASPGIEFDLPYGATVTLRLLDGAGAELVTLINKKPFAEGLHRVDLAEFGKNVAFYQLTVERDGAVLTDTKKLVMTL